MSQDEDQASTFVWKGSLDISRVSEIRDELRDAVAKGAPILLDAQAAERADTAFVQMLVAFFAFARESNVEAGWQRVSEAVCRAAKQIGLAGQIALSDAEIEALGQSA